MFLLQLPLMGKINALQGLSFKWQAEVADKRIKSPVIYLPDGVFKPQFAGEFVITAETNSFSATTRIFVAKDSHLRAMQEIDEQGKIERKEKKNRGNSEKLLSPEVKELLSLPLPNSVSGSSRMSEEDKKALQEWNKSDKERKDPLKKENNNKKVSSNDKNEEKKELKNEDNYTASSDSKYLVNPENREGGNVVNNSETSQQPLGVVGVDYPNNRVYADIYAPNGLAIPVRFYVDGLMGAGTLIGTSTCYTQVLNQCRAYLTVPAQYRDGNTHYFYGYANFSGSTWTKLNNYNGSATFLFPPFNDPSWNNSNFNSATSPTVGDFSFVAPVLSLGGRGLDVNLTMNYNSLLWHKSGNNVTYDIDKGSPAPGWNLGFGKMMDMDTQGGAMVVDKDGTRHSYNYNIQPGYTSGYSTIYAKTIDGSNIDYIAYRTPSGLSSATAFLPDGTIVSYGAGYNKVLYPIQIKDRHGNYISIAYQNNQGPNITTITDSLGGVIIFNYDTNNRLVSVTGPGQNGSARVCVRIHYSQKQVNYAFSGLNAAIANTNPHQIDAIYYPDLNTGYWFGDNDSYSNYGMIAKVSERRGMSWSGSGNNDQGTISAGTMAREMVYNYPLTPNASLTDPPQYSTMTESWNGMTTAPAVTTYNINSFANPRTTTITLPNGNQIKQLRYYAPNAWNDNLLYQSETLSSTGQVLSKEVTTWIDQLEVYYSPKITKIETTDEKNQTSKRTFTYDGSLLSQLASISEYDYSNNLLRKKIITYENGTNYLGNYTGLGGKLYWTSGRHIFGLAKTEELFDGNNVRLSRVDYNYDQTTLVNTPNVVMYDQMYNPQTTQTVQGNCIQWDQYWVEDPYWGYYGGGYGGYWESYCVEYEQIPYYDSSTLAHGNVTNTTTYAEASILTGAISYDSTYDITGNVRTTTTDCCQQMSFNYTTNTQYSQPESMTKGSPSDPNQQNTQSAVYDYNTGHVNNSTDFNGRTTTYNYDATNRLDYTAYPSGMAVQIWYHPGPENYYGTIVYQQAHVWDVSNRRDHVGHWFNGRGQEIMQRSHVNNNSANYEDAVNWIETNVTYDQMGRKTSVSVPHTQGVATAGYSTYQYDQLSRVTQVTAPDGSTSKTFYNEATKPSSAASNIGNTVRSQDAWGRERWARTDDFGRLVEVVEPDPNGNGSIFDAGNMVTTYGYDAKDQLVQVNQGNQLRAFRYDSLGRLTRQKLAEQNGTLNDAGQFVGANNGPWSDAFSYDNRSNLVQRVDARGVKTNFAYNNDPLNRLQSVSYDKSSADTTHNIADASPVNLSYMTTGDKTRVWKAEMWYVTEENNYDIEGRISEYKVFYAGQTGQQFVTSYLYDSLSRLTEVRYPAQYGIAGAPRKVVTPTYDETSRLKELKVDNQIQMSEIVYNPMSQVTQLKTGASTGNADVEQYSYDQQTGLLTNQKVIKQNSNTTLLDLSYNYNRGNSKGSLNGKTGQLTHVIDNLNRNKDRVYEFDSLGRLQVAKGGGATGVGGVQANWTQNYGYDRYGNRLTVTSSGVTQNNQAVPTDGLPTQSYDNASNRITTAGYIYDLAGNIIRGQKPDGGWQRYVYDAAGRLKTIKDDAGNDLQDCGYGASRQRVFRNEGGVAIWFVWGGSSVLAEYTATGWGSTYDWAKSYIYAGSRLLSTFTKNGASETLEFHHPDRLGTRLVTNNSANTSYEQSTLPFGTALNAESTGFSNQVFTSYDRSTVASLDYAVNRSYSSGQGRFTTVDPIGFGSSSLGNPQSLNLYSYVENNPIDLTDPSGLDGSSISFGGIGGIGGTGNSTFLGVGRFLTGLLGSLLSSNRTPTFIFRNVLFPASKANNTGTIRANRGSQRTDCDNLVFEFVSKLTNVANNVFGIFDSIEQIGYMMRNLLLPRRKLSQSAITHFRNQTRELLCR